MDGQYIIPTKDLIKDLQELKTMFSASDLEGY
jgi:hypothetical protein